MLDSSRCINICFNYSLETIFSHCWVFYRFTCFIVSQVDNWNRTWGLISFCFLPVKPLNLSTTNSNKHTSIKSWIEISCLRRYRCWSLFSALLILNCHQMTSSLTIKQISDRIQRWQGLVECMPSAPQISQRSAMTATSFRIVRRAG